MNEADVKIGQPVTYWSVVEPNGEKFYPHKTRIRTSDVWTLGGTRVCKVDGIAGGVALSHVELREEDNG